MTGYTALTLSRAKAMRREPTEAERALWKLLRAHRLAAFKFRRQQPIGIYLADFVCHKARLIVEADGSQHLDSSSDAVRTSWLASVGYVVLRFWNNDILLRAASVSDAIYDALTSPSPCSREGASCPSPSKGRGEKDA